MPSLPTIRDRSLAVFLIFAAAVNTWMLRDFFFEDAFITYRYAMNIAAGNGFVFNLGERVLGTTTPLYTLLLSVFSWFGLSLPIWSTALYCSALSACGYFGARILRGQGSPNAGVAFAVLVVWGAGGSLQFVGMETALYLAMIFAAIHFANCKNEPGLGVLLGCIACTRYDGVVAIGIILVYRWMQTRSFPRRTIVVGGALFATWLLFAQFYFGSPLPNTLGAKASDTSFVQYWSDSIEVQFLQFVRPLRRVGIDLAYTHLALGVLASALFVPILLRARRMSAQSWLMVAIASFLWLAYSIIGPPAKHSWHLTLAILCLLAAGLGAWGTLLEPTRLERPLQISTLLLLAIASGFLPMGAQSDAQQSTGLGNYRDRVWSYESIGHWILDHGLEDELLMTLEPGYISCLTGNPVVDAAGLVTKGIRFHGPAGERDTFASLSERFQPGLIINRTTTVVSPSLLANYTPVYGYRVMTLLMRKDLVTRHAIVLADKWASSTPALLRRERVLKDPFKIDFQADRVPRQWQMQGLARAGFGRAVPGLKTKMGAFHDGYLSTKRAVGKLGEFARGPLIKVDFDVLTFGFGATDPERTRAELLIDGVAVMKIGGKGPAESPKVAVCRFPMDAWQGKFARVRFADVGSKTDFLVADGIRPQNRVGAVPFENFDSGAYGPNWIESFGKTPTAAHWLVAKYGPGMALGPFSATSIGLGGKQRMRSQPFPIERAAMSFVAFDFARHASSVKLVVNGKAVRTYTCENAQELVPVVWPVGDLKGQLATIVVTDHDQQPERWVGIDSIVFFDGYADSPANLEGKKRAAE